MIHYTREFPHVQWEFSLGTGFAETEAMQPADRPLLLSLASD